jgi:pimeloyl-ACP methyl ester carboxylesterase
MADFTKPTMIKTNGINLAIYEEKPAGKACQYPVILVHGMPELAYSWRHQMKPLADAGYHVIAPDVRGVGFSDSPEKLEDYALEIRLKDMVGILDHFGYEKGIFVGHDFGGAIVWGMGIYHSERVAGVVAMNAPYLDMPINPIELYQILYGPRNYFAYFQTKECEDTFNADPARTFRFYMRKDTGQGTNLSRSKRHDPESMSHVHWIHDDESTWPGALVESEDDIHFYAESYRRHGFGPALNWYRSLPTDFHYQHRTYPDGNPVIQQPVLAIGGEHDYIASHVFFDSLDDYCANWEKIVIPQCGHWSQQEKPDAVNAVLIDWLHQHFR